MLDDAAIWPGAVDVEADQAELDHRQAVEDVPGLRLVLGLEHEDGTLAVGAAVDLADLLIGEEPEGMVRLGREMGSELLRLAAPGVVVQPRLWKNIMKMAKSNKATACSSTRSRISLFAYLRLNSPPLNMAKT